MVLTKTLIASLLIFCFIVVPEAKAQDLPLFSPVIRVNNSVITKFELEQRTKFLSALKFPGNPAQLAQTQLIEERLKQSESEKLNIVLSDTEIEDALKRFATRANLSLIEFTAELKKLGIYSDTFHSYVETQLIWQKVVTKKFGAQSNISNLQLRRSKSIAKFEDTVQVLLTEIIIPFSKKDIKEKESIANQLKNIKTIEGFSNAARKHSKAPTANMGGRVKWQNFDTLPEIIKPIIFGLSPGEVSEPIRLAKAIALFQLRDIREKRDEKTQADFLDYITLNSQLSNLKLLEYIQSNFYNCDDLVATMGDQTQVTLLRSKLFLREVPKSLAIVLKNLDTNESKIIIDDETSKLVILCDRISQGAYTIETIQNDKNVLQNNRLKYLARSFLETLKDNARIVIK